MTAPPEPNETLDLLRRWHAGDRGALERLVELQLPWLRRYVSQRMSPQQRAFVTSEDVLQEVLFDLFQSVPAFLPENEAQFRGLVARIVVNRLHDVYDHATAARRDRVREEPLPSGTCSRIGCFAQSSGVPDRAAAENETRGFVQLAMHLVDPADRQLIELREWQGLEFAEIGNRHGIGADTARMRFNAAIARLGRQIQRLQWGQLEDLVADVEAGSEPAPGPSDRVS